VSTSPCIFAAPILEELKLDELVVLCNALMTSWYEVELKRLEVETNNLRL
jgi:hypothetical protein